MDSTILGDEHAMVKNGDGSLDVNDVSVGRYEATEMESIVPPMTANQKRRRSSSVSTSTPCTLYASESPDCKHSRRRSRSRTLEATGPDCDVIVMGNEQQESQSPDNDAAVPCTVEHEASTNVNLHRWRHKDGRELCCGKFRGLADYEISIQSTDGDTRVIAISDLHAEDQQFMLEQLSLDSRYSRNIDKSEPKSFPNEANVRQWKEATGTFTCRAEFLGLRDGKVHLHKVNGIKILVPVERLSESDLEHVEQVTEHSMRGEMEIKDSGFYTRRRYLKRFLIALSEKQDAVMNGKVRLPNAAGEKVPKDIHQLEDEDYKYVEEVMFKLLSE